MYFYSWEFAEVLTRQRIDEGMAIPDLSKNIVAYQTTALIKESEIGSQQEKSQIKSGRDIVICIKEV